MYPSYIVTFVLIQNILLFNEVGSYCSCTSFSCRLSQVFYHKTMLLSAKCNGKVRVTTLIKISKLL